MPFLSPDEQRRVYLEAVSQSIKDSLAVRHDFSWPLLTTRHQAVPQADGDSTSEWALTRNDCAFLRRGKISPA